MKLLIPLIIKFNAVLGIALIPSKMPLKMDLTPFHALDQLPVNTPLIKSLNPLKMLLKLSMIGDIAVKAPTNATDNTFATPLKTLVNV